MIKSVNHTPTTEQQMRIKEPSSVWTALTINIKDEAWVNTTHLMQLFLVLGPQFAHVGIQLLDVVVTKQHLPQERSGNEGAMIPTGH